MAIGEVIIKFVGIVLVIVGFALLLSVVGVPVLGIGLAPVWLAVIMGVLFLWGGIEIVRGGKITL